MDHNVIASRTARTAAPGVALAKPGKYFRFAEVVKIGNQKDFCLQEPQINGTLCASRPTQRGVRDRNERGTGCGGREVRKAIAHDAYGKSVWSRRRSAGVNAPGRRPISQGATEAKELFSGESAP